MPSSVECDVLGTKFDFSQYYKHLESLSRSFSFCILQLHSPAKEWVALGYLLCRVVDIIEDINWPNPEKQARAFQQFKWFLTHEPSQKDFIDWLQNFPVSVSLAERALLEDLIFLLTDINQLPKPICDQLIKTIQQMIDGMMYFIGNYMHNNQFLLSLLKTTNQYCFFVAGIVGEWLTYLFTYLIAEFEFTDNLLNQAFHFGFFLQKINIFKDQISDNLAGRYFFLSREELRQSMIVNAVQAMAYLKAIPVVSGRPYRIFCAWSFFIGLASLKWIDKSWRVNNSYKLGSRETTHILMQIKERIDDNSALETLFGRYLPESSVANNYLNENINFAKKIPSWFSAIYPIDPSKINMDFLNI